MAAPSRTSAPQAWHTLTADAALTTVDSRLAGLTPPEVAKRREELGPNTLPEGRNRPLWRMLLDQFTDFMILVLIAAAIVAGLVGEPIDSLSIVIIVLLNGAIGFFQERRAQNAMAALRKMAAHQTRVRREDVVSPIEASQLVPGDIVLLEAGNVVPADLRLLECARLHIAEAALTGESTPIEKNAAALTDATSRIGDRTNMAFKGTLVSAGRGVGVVTATGLNTELGTIARMLDDEDEVKTPLQKRLTRFGTKLAWAVLVICAIVFVAGLIRGEDLTLMFLTAVSLAVAAIPEALPAVVVIALALGASRMVKNHALIRRLPAVETLGSVTYICSDKTGTLTENKMHAEVLAASTGETPTTTTPWPDLYRAMALVNDATPSADTFAGDPTEVALVLAAKDSGHDKTTLDVRYPRVAELPFDSERKRMSTVHFDPDLETLLVCVKGAPESLLDRCTTERTPSGDRPFSLPDKLVQAERLAARGLRVLAIAERRIQPAAVLPDAVGALADPKTGLETDLTLLGLVGLIDPPRAEVLVAVDECKTAGIVPVMITGDHPATALAIAERLGIASATQRVMTGDELARLSDEDFAAIVADLRVYARVDPEQKIRIVKALQTHGEFTAMTGDGVNDAPALKRADIGVAMGKGGTDVAREAAHMVLLDDNFATIVSAVREGRKIFDNIRKFIKYVMTGNSGEIWTIFLAPFLGLPIPLLPIHILWINLVTDGFPGLALTAEPPERNIMQRPPRPPNEGIFAHGMWQHILWVGLLMGAVCLIVQAWAIDAGAHSQTMVFTVLCLSQLGHVLAIRSERESFFTLPNNRMLTITVLFTVALQLMTIYIPMLNPIFKTQALTLIELGICLGASSIVFIAVELEKVLVRRRHLYGE